MNSLRLANPANEPVPRNPLAGADRSADVAVVGAGTTGLITAVLLARAGKNVLLLEGPASRNLTAAR